MKTVALTEAKDRLSALVEEAETTHEIIEITRHGHPAAVLMSAQDLESLQETIFWLSQQGVLDDVRAAASDLESGSTLSGGDLRAQYGLPAR